MAMTVHCDIASAEKQLFSGLVQLLVVSGSEGELGIRPGHTPLLTLLKPGPVHVRTENGDEEVFYVSSGFLEVQPQLVTILADAAERAHDLDEAEAEQARQRAHEALDSQHSEMDHSLAQVALAEAMGRLKTIEQLKKSAQR